MEIKEIIVAKWSEIIKREGISAPDFSSDFRLLDTELDSLGFAILVTELELEFGIDPFTKQTEAYYPETFSEFVTFYEQNIVKKH